MINNNDCEAVFVGGVAAAAPIPTRLSHLSTAKSQQLKGNRVFMSTVLPNLIVHTDGASRSNPGHAACAFVVSLEGQAPF